MSILSPDTGRASGRRLPAGTWPRALGSLGLGAVVGAFGTVMHRSVSPWGLALCLLLVLAGAVTARAWGGLVPLVAYAVGWCALVTLLSLKGPGGDVLIPAGGGRISDLLGQVWVLGPWLPIGVTAFLPARWFSDRPASSARAGADAPAEGGTP